MKRGPSGCDCPLFIDGQHLAGGGAPIPVLDKFSLQQVGQAQVADADQLRRAVGSAHAAYRRGAPSQAERGDILERAAAGVQRASAELIGLMQQEAGFPAVDAAAEVTRCMQTLRLSATEARRFAGAMIPLAGSLGHAGKLGFTIRVPLGVVLAVTPFNSPLNTVAHKIAPAFAAGNAVVLKPSSDTPMTAAKFAEILSEAGVPQGFLSVVYGGAEVVRQLLEQPQVRYVAFTGSTETGRAIQRAAGLRRTQMELGSIAFTILCADADLESALPKVVNAAFRKAGQVCTSIQILLVHRSLRAAVEGPLAQLTAAVPFGDPRDPRTVTGPVISEHAAVRIAQWIQSALDGGARRLVGGAREGSVVPPTLLTDVTDSMDVVSREVFGPVLNVLYFDTLAEAIARVNATPYGLAAGIFTRRIDCAFEAIRTLDVGSVYINETSSSRVDSMPYGGSKDSGFGREGPEYSIREMSEERMVTFSGFGP
ncbi:MAG TPA: aldehyde dehydrogenase family protein [Steroidobacteraceae bacterium]|nr:aldehyde dehydrogenase family protein [Steroidobacteraceae bacterium]